MKYHAILFMYNDENRALNVIKNFKKHNPNIFLTVYNGGNNYDSIQNNKQVDNYILGKNLWHTKTRHAPGSFSYEYIEYLFLINEKYNFEWLLFLETDVYTNKPITKDPLYDVSGPMKGCGWMCSLVAYDYWSNYLANKPFNENNETSWPHKYHTGCGGTCFSKNFFNKCKSNLHLLKQAYDLIPFHCYQDLMISLLARYSGCTIGDWDDATDVGGSMIFKNNQWNHEPLNLDKALIHGLKE